MTDHDLWSEFGYTCGICDHSESWTTELASNLSAILHVRTAHPEQATRYAKYAQVPLAHEIPEQYGDRLEGWESQL